LKKNVFSQKLQQILKQAASVDCIVGSAQPAQPKPARVVGMEFSWSNLEKQ